MLSGGVFYFEPPCITVVCIGLYFIFTDQKDAYFNACSSLRLTTCPLMHRQAAYCSPTHILYEHNNLTLSLTLQPDSSVREYVFYVFFQISKKHDFYVFFK